MQQNEDNTKVYKIKVCSGGNCPRVNIPAQLATDLGMDKWDGLELKKEGDKLQLVNTGSIAPNKVKHHKLHKRKSNGRTYTYFYSTAFKIGDQYQITFQDKKAFMVLVDKPETKKAGW